MGGGQAGLRRTSPTGVEGTKSSGGTSGVCARAWAREHVTCGWAKRDWGDVTSRMGSAELQGSRKRGRGPSTKALGAGVPGLPGEGRWATVSHPR